MRHKNTFHKLEIKKKKKEELMNDSFKELAMHQEHWRSY